MRLSALLILAATQACGGSHWHGPVRTADWSEEPVRPSANGRVTEIVSLSDLIEGQKDIGDPDDILEKSFPEDECSYVTAAVRGSFTEAGRAQVMYSVRSDGCGGRGAGTVVVYEEGREVRRYEGAATARRAVDLDGDGKDEWVETSSSCKEECRTEAWIMRTDGEKAVEVVHVESAQVDECSSEGVIRWTSVEYVHPGREKRVQHLRPCP